MLVLCVLLHEVTMLIYAADLKGLVVRATDGELGTVEEFYFDDETWRIRYLIVETGTWLSGRKVLISPISILRADWAEKRLEVSLTKQQVEASPEVDTQKPVSRQQESDYLGYYGYPIYWSSLTTYPTDVNPLPNTPIDAPGDTHLRSSEAVEGYYIEATDGEIGHLDGFVVDDATWDIRFIEVSTRNWWPGKRVLVSPEWVQRVSWTASRVYVDLPRETIQGAPEFKQSEPISRQYEEQLYEFYGRQPYWKNKSVGQS